MRQYVTISTSTSIHKCICIFVFIQLPKIYNNLNLSVFINFNIFLLDPFIVYYHLFIS